MEWQRGARSIRCFVKGNRASRVKCLTRRGAERLPSASPLCAKPRCDCFSLTGNFMKSGDHNKDPLPPGSTVTFHGHKGKTAAIKVDPSEEYQIHQTSASTMEQLYTRDCCSLTCAPITRSARFTASLKICSCRAQGASTRRPTHEFARNMQSQCQTDERHYGRNEVQIQ